MDPVKASVVISRPLEEVFSYLADVANLPEWTDHFTHGWHLTREDTYGRGAGVRFAVKQRGNRYPWVDATIIEFQPEHRIVLAGRAGKFNRIRSLIVFELDTSSAGSTRVDISYETEPKGPRDRLYERRGFFKRSWGKAAKRLRDVLEEDRRRGERATIAGGARKPASGFRFAAPGAPAKK